MEFFLMVLLLFNVFLFLEYSTDTSTLEYITWTSELESMFVGNNQM